MEKDQALRLMEALAEEEALGVADGEAVTRFLNAHFIRACQVAQPALQNPSCMRAWSRSPGETTIENRNQWSDFFRQLADALHTPVAPKEN